MVPVEALILVVERTRIVLASDPLEEDLQKWGGNVTLVGECRDKRRATVKGV